MEYSVTYDWYAYMTYASRPISISHPKAAHIDIISDKI